MARLIDMFGLAQTTDQKEGIKYGRTNHVCGAACRRLFPDTSSSGLYFKSGRYGVNMDIDTESDDRHAIMSMDSYLARVKEGLFEAISERVAPDERVRKKVKKVQNIEGDGVNLSPSPSQHTSPEGSTHDAFQ